MIIALVGESGAGKSLIEKMLSEELGYEKMISYTTRQQRHNEVNGKDYHFIDNETFKETIKKGLFAEYEEYSQGRFYGTLISDFNTYTNKVTVLTPNGLRQLKRNCDMRDVVTVYVTANLGTRIKRYIDRCGVAKFSFADKDEISSRVERDFGMFLGIKDEVDLVIENSQGKPIADSVGEIIEYVKKCSTKETE